MAHDPYENYPQNRPLPHPGTSAVESMGGGADTQPSNPPDAARPGDLEPLTSAQQSMLYEAFLKARKDGIYSNPECGWFYPSRYDTAVVYGVPATAAVLCGRGLLEFKTVSYVKVRGAYKAINEYRITEHGKGIAATVEQHQRPRTSAHDAGSRGREAIDN